MTLPSIFISWISATAAAGELAATSRVSLLAVRVMKAPPAFWWGTVARAQASVTLTSACATAPASDRKRTVKAEIAMRAVGAIERDRICMESSSGDRQVGRAESHGGAPGRTCGRGRLDASGVRRALAARAP